MDKVQKIREEIERLMYGFNLEADIASCEDAETEKLADIKYQLCKKILDYIDEVQKEPIGKVLDTESMIEAHKQKLISQVNGMKDSPFVNMCLDSYKQGISEILDTLNLSNAQTIDATIGYWNHSGLSVDVKLPKDLKEGSKCKILIIKNE